MIAEILRIVATVFGVIGVGWLSARIGLLKEGTSRGLSDFVFVVAIPILLFKTLAEADFTGLSPWRIWIAYFGGAAVAWALGHLGIRQLFGRSARAGVIAGISSAFANTVLVGIPLVATIYGEAGMARLLIVLSIHLPVMMLVSLVLNARAEKLDGAEPDTTPDRPLRTFLAGLVRNPIIVGILTGGIWRLTGIPLAGAPADIVGMIAASAGPVALFASGLELARYGLTRNAAQGGTIAAVKLLAMPAAVMGLAVLFGLEPLSVAVLTLVAACPTGVNAFLIAQRFGIGEAIAINAMTLSTLFGIVTITGWLAFLRLLAG